MLTARPRLHISLADMGHASARAFGGIGFSIDQPSTVLEFGQCDRIELQGLERLDEEAIHDVHQLAGRLKSALGGVGFRVIIQSTPPQHVGFGSKTSLLLGLIAGLNALTARNWSQEEMQRLSGRGGASGVGIHAFFTGGIVWDAGQRRGAPLSPAGSGIASELPPLMVRLAFPEAWSVVLILPSEVPMTGEQEERFFAKSAPVPRIEALATLAILYHGILPAMKLVDYDGLARALRELHETSFKKRELDRWSEKTRACLVTLSGYGLAAGMSSVGPLIYVIVPKNNKPVVDQVRKSCERIELRMFKVVEACNSGYELRLGK
jgi:beta-ribofuranosylaminobenzene 5'-phosphate synthase